MRIVRSKRTCSCRRRLGSRRRVICNHQPTCKVQRTTVARTHGNDGVSVDHACSTDQQNFGNQPAWLPVYDLNY
jgi:ribosomal protein L35AE/L33A